MTFLCSLKLCCEPLRDSTTGEGFSRHPPLSSRLITTSPPDANSRLWSQKLTLQICETWIFTPRNSTYRGITRRTHVALRSRVWTTTRSMTIRDWEDDSLFLVFLAIPPGSHFMRISLISPISGDGTRKLNVWSGLSSNHLQEQSFQSITAIPSTSSYVRCFKYLKPPSMSLSSVSWAAWFSRAILNMRNKSDKCFRFEHEREGKKRRIISILNILTEKEIVTFDAGNHILKEI